MDHLVLGQDIFGRAAKFERGEVDETYPAYLLEHMDEYRHLVMPKITAVSKLYPYLDITAGRFMRKAFRKIKRILSR